MGLKICIKTGRKGKASLILENKVAMKLQWKVKCSKQRKMMIASGRRWNYPCSRETTFGFDWKMKLAFISMEGNTVHWFHYWNN